jgi:nucleotide-binding universal stress UspA family protein
MDVARRVGKDGLMNVLAGTNGSSGAEKATEFGFAYCRAFNANLYILYVVSTKSDEDKDKNIKNGMRVLGRLKIRGADLGVPMATLLEAGEPHDNICEAAKRLKCDMIVIGNSEKGRGLFGASTAEQVFKNAHCTVTVVK